MPTGEHQLTKKRTLTNTIGTSSPVTIGLLIACASALVGVGGALAKIDTHTEKFALMQAQIDAIKATHDNDTKESREKELRTELRLQRVEDVNTQVLTAIGKLQGTIERMESAAATRSAGGRVHPRLSIPLPRQLEPPSGKLPEP